MLPLVSILIPAYNAERWIAETIGSALGQSWENKEIVVVDDGSTDGTLEVARQFASERVKVLSQPNGGASAARNRAYHECRGEFIQWLDADDLMAEDKIALQMAARDSACTGRTIMTGPWGHFMYRVHKARFLPTRLWENLSPVEFLTLKMEGRGFMTNSGWLMSRELAEAAGPWDERLSNDDDGEYFARVLTKADAVRFVPESNTYYRLSGGNQLSFSSLVSPSQQANNFLCIRLSIEHLRSLSDESRQRRACLGFLGRKMAAFSPERPDIVSLAEDLARELGGSLSVPKLPLKYAGIEMVFGASVAKRVRSLLPATRLRLARNWDHLLHVATGRKTGPGSGHGCGGKA